MRKKFRPLSRSKYELCLKPNQRYRHAFNDQRLMRRHQRLYESMLREESIVVNQVSESHSERTSYYRFMNNKQVGVLELLNHHCQIEESLISDGHILCIGDSTSMSLKGRLGSIKDKAKIGVLDDNKTPGMHSHACMAIDAEGGQVLGLSDLLIWNRPKRNSDSAEAVSLSYEEKESYKWELGSVNSWRSLSFVSKITHIFDQDSDNYEALARILKNKKAEIVIRSKNDRVVCFEEEDLRMSQALSRQAWKMAVSVDIRALNHYSPTHGKRIQRKARTALLRLRWISVQLHPPAHYKGDVFIDRIMSVLQIKEDLSTVPEGEEAIEWRILTSHRISEQSQALQIVAYYQMRWYIEQLFRILKKQGLDIEATQLESKDAIIKQWIMAFSVACKVLQLTLARDQCQGHAIGATFDSKDQIVLKHLCEKLEGKTAKLQNPFPDTQLSWATWIIARLGGWKGYKSQRSPGPITILRGLKKFTHYRKAADIFLFSKPPPEVLN